MSTKSDQQVEYFVHRDFVQSEGVYGYVDDDYGPFGSASDARECFDSIRAQFDGGHIYVTRVESPFPSLSPERLIAMLSNGIQDSAVGRGIWTETLENIRTVVAWSTWDTERSPGNENHYEASFLRELEREQVLSRYKEALARNIEAKLHQLTRIGAHLALLLEHRDTNRSAAWANRLRMISDVSWSKIGEWAERKLRREDPELAEALERSSGVTMGNRKPELQSGRGRMETSPRSATWSMSMNQAASKASQRALLGRRCTGPRSALRRPGQEGRKG